ncbi:akirin [Chrysoperla carnea]|uniref:akirin n=1 Tax=Chrysoperla carnea TaxID=189513 RepID=UPI001D071BB9|nr:akirin [Chrysoperla carnea]
MACATLKRHLDWDQTLRPSKRRRCAPLCQSPQQSSSPRLKEPSPFTEAVTPQLTPEKMAANIRDEIRRLHRRKQLTYVFPEGGESSSSHNNRGYSNAALEERMQDSGSDGGNSSGAESPTPLNVSRAERALFTFSQVNMICERMVRERETELREQYDQVLHTKLAEQYDAFVKFTYDQLQRRFDAAPSYLS